MTNDEIKQFIHEFTQTLNTLESAQKKAQKLNIEVSIPESEKLIDNIRTLTEIVSQLKEKPEQTLNLEEIVSAIKDININVEAPTVNLPAPKVIVQPTAVTVPETIINAPDEVSIKKPKWLESIFDSIIKKIPEQAKEIRIASSATRPVAVRLSNGKKFYNAFFSAIQGAMPFIFENERAVVESYTKEFAVQLDKVSSTVMYIGKAQAGTSLSTAGWRIKKAVFTNGSISVTWADGVQTFTKSWADRASYSYS